MHRGIPTTYAGVNFRSRLEAKWAAFFDLLGWDWDYEPIDLDGYIPDFLLPQFMGGGMLVEVKPLLGIEDPAVEEAAQKIRDSGWRSGESVIVGSRLGWRRTDDFTNHWGYDGSRKPVLGLMALQYDDGQFDWTGTTLADFAPAAFLAKCASCGSTENPKWTIAPGGCDERQPVRGFCRRCFKYDGLIEGDGEVEPLWREAGNRVQWKPRSPADDAADLERKATRMARQAARSRRRAGL